MGRKWLVGICQSIIGCESQKSEFGEMCSEASATCSEISRSILAILTPISAHPLLVSGLPDLTIDSNRLQTSIVFKTQVIKSTDCAFVEGCVTGTGKRKLMKFDVAIPNIGTADLVLGDPTATENDGIFQLSSCHGHYHLIGFASYELLNASGTTILTGRKQAFCLEDYTKVVSTAAPAKYTCSNQGIQVGWSDVYSSYLDCQWLDVTDIPAGNYRLKVTVNATPSLSPKLTESDYSNNTANVPVTIKK